MNSKQELCIGDDVWVQCPNGKMLKMEVGEKQYISMDYRVTLIAKDDHYKYECSCSVDKILENDDGEWELGKHYNWFTQVDL